MRTTIRVFLILFAAMEGFIGLWGTLAPLSFYEDGPVPGLGWVALLPPYNEHLLRDFTGMSLAMAVVLTVAAVKLTPLWVRTSVGSLFLFSVPHTIFHTVHLEHFTPAQATAQTVALIVTTLLQLVVFLMAGRLAREPA